MFKIQYDSYCVVRELANALVLSDYIEDAEYEEIPAIQPTTLQNTIEPWQ